VRNIWVFGSTAKGSIEPNDLDLLIRLEECGRRQSWQQVGFDPAYLRRTGIRVARDPRKEALMWLSRGMKNVSRHDFESELVEIDIKLPLWPVFDPKLKA
jgi:predicted nucleotidyltransferase